MSVYAVYDTNVLVSAFLSRQSDSAVVLAVEALLAGRVIPLYNADILQEYRDVLRRDKFRLPEQLIDKVIRYIVEAGVDSRRIASEQLFNDPGDVVFYEVALSKEGAFLVTGNKKHFPATTIVVSPREFLDILCRKTE